MVCSCPWLQADGVCQDRPRFCPSTFASSARSSARHNGTPGSGGDDADPSGAASNGAAAGGPADSNSGDSSNGGGGSPDAAGCGGEQRPRWHAHIEERLRRVRAALEALPYPPVMVTIARSSDYWTPITDVRNNRHRRAASMTLLPHVWHPALASGIDAVVAVGLHRFRLCYQRTPKTLSRGERNMNLHALALCVCVPRATHRALWATKCNAVRGPLHQAARAPMPRAMADCTVRGCRGPGHRNRVRRA